VFAQTNNIESEVDLGDFKEDSLHYEQLRLKAEQGNLSDCEFAKKNANRDFDKNNYIRYSKELVGNCIYCDLLRLNYSVNWIFQSDIFSDNYYRCYNKEMSQLLILKYGFDIFQKTSEEVNAILERKANIRQIYYKPSCIPNLITDERIYIQDSCIEDTLTVNFRVTITFEHSLIDTVIPIIVQSINLIDMEIRSVNSPYVIASLSKLTPIEYPWLQYIWDLCSAKIAYWYKFQPYNELSEGERIKKGNTLYMRDTVWLIPAS
jgi:hypothetical protein